MNDPRVIQQDLRDQGFVKIPNCYALADIECMRNRVVQIVQGSFPLVGRRFYPETHTGDYRDVSHADHSWQGPEVNYRKVADLEYDPVFLSALQCTELAEICTFLLGPQVSVMRVTMMDKAPFGGTFLPWHQDVASSWPTDIQPQLAIWFPLDVLTPDSGTLEVVSNSHKHGVIGNGHVLPPEKELFYAPAKKIKKLFCDLGDIFLFDAKILHRSGLNSTASHRRAINAVLMPGKAFHTKKLRNYPRLYGDESFNPSYVEELDCIPCD